MIALPIAAALGLVALFGYAARYLPGGKSQEPTVDIDQARQAINELESISQQVRRNLAMHQASIVRFQERVDALSDESDVPGWEQFAHEAEQMLLPTQRLSNQLASAYDEIRRRSHVLQNLAD